VDSTNFKDDTLRCWEIHCGNTSKWISASFSCYIQLPWCNL